MRGQIGQRKPGSCSVSTYVSLSLRTCLCTSTDVSLYPSLSLGFCLSLSLVSQPQIDMGSTGCELLLQLAPKGPQSCPRPAPWAITLADAAAAVAPYPA